MKRLVFKKLRFPNSKSAETHFPHFGRLGCHLDANLEDGDREVGMRGGAQPQAEVRMRFLNLWKKDIEKINKNLGYDSNYMLRNYLQNHCNLKPNSIF